MGLTKRKTRILNSRRAFGWTDYLKYTRVIVSKAYALKNKKPIEDFPHFKKVHTVKLRSRVSQGTSYFLLRNEDSTIEVMFSPSISLILYSRS